MVYLKVDIKDKEERTYIYLFKEAAIELGI